MSERGMERLVMVGCGGGSSLTCAAESPPITTITTRCSPVGKGCNLTLSYVLGNSHVPDVWQPAPPEWQPSPGLHGTSPGYLQPSHSVSVGSHIRAGALRFGTKALDGQYMGRFDASSIAAIWLREKKRFW